METEFTVKEFLDSVNNSSTKREYKTGIKKFSEWFKKSPEEILQIRKEDLTLIPNENPVDYRNRASRFEKKLELFHSDLLKNYSINSARTYTAGMIQLFNYYSMPIMFKNSQKKISKTVKSTKNFPLEIDHVRDMFQVGDLRERVILSLATDLGLRISDFVKIKKADIHLNQEAPIPIEIMTNKEKIVASGFLSSESVDLLKIYIPTLENTDNPYLFPSNHQGHITPVWLNTLLQRLANDAKIQLNGKSLTFHCFRKMFLSTAINSGIGQTAGKKLCGKYIPQSDDTYLTTVNLREKFIILKNFSTIQIQTNNTTESIESLKMTISEMNIKYKEEIENLNNIIKSHEYRLNLNEGLIQLMNLPDELKKNLNIFIEQTSSLSDEEYITINARIDEYLNKEVPKITGTNDNEYLITAIKSMFYQARKNKQSK